jgi:hypothetical protein
VQGAIVQALAQGELIGAESGWLDHATY